jgi:hypothetical protein
VDVNFLLAEWLAPAPLDYRVPLAKQLVSFIDFVYSLARDFKITERN